MSEVLNKPMFGHVSSNTDHHWSAPNKHFIAAAGEFVGTFLFLFTGYLIHAMSVGFAPESATGGGNTNQTVVFIALGYGFSLLVAAWVLYRVSGGLFNPAITLGLVLTGNLTPMRGLLFLPTQLLGAISAAAVVSVIIPVDIKLVETTLAPNMNVAQGLFLEMVCTPSHPPVMSFHTFTSLTHHFTVPNRPPDVHNPHAGRRKVQRHLHRAHRHRPRAVRRRARGHQLLGRLDQPGKILWALCRGYSLYWVPLDLLAGAVLGHPGGCGLLSLYQGMCRGFGSGRFVAMFANVCLFSSSTTSTRTPVKTTRRHETERVAR
jgi:hypothetical protein